MGLEVGKDVQLATFQILSSQKEKIPKVSVFLDIERNNILYKVPYLATFRNKGRPLSDRATKKTDKEARYLNELTRAHVGMVQSMLPRDLEGDSVNYELTRHYPHAANLWEFIQRQKLSPLELLTMMSPAVDAIQFLHENNYVHRDVKPSNILAIPKTDLFPYETLYLDDCFSESDHTCMLYDFETISKANEARPKPARTRRYAPPEAFGEELESEIPPINPQTDVFCLGVSIAELLLAIKEPKHYLLHSELDRQQRERKMDLILNGYMSPDLIAALESAYPHSFVITALEEVIQPSTDNRVHLPQFWRDIYYAVEELSK